MKSYDNFGTAIWGGMLLGTMLWTVLMGLHEYEELKNTQRLEAICEQAGGVPARIKPDVLCFNKEVFVGAPPR